jgi:hypothetical protein
MPTTTTVGGRDSIEAGASHSRIMPSASTWYIKGSRDTGLAGGFNASTKAAATAPAAGTASHHQRRASGLARTAADWSIRSIR